MPDEDDDWHQCNVALFHELQELKARNRQPPKQAAHPNPKPAPLPTAPKLPPQLDDADRDWGRRGRRVIPVPNTGQ